MMDMGKRTILMLCLALGVCSSGIAQQIKASGEPLEEVLKHIEQKPAIVSIGRKKM